MAPKGMNANKYWPRARVGLTLLSAALLGLYGSAVAAQTLPAGTAKLDAKTVGGYESSTPESLSDLLSRVLPKDPQVRSSQALADAAEQRFKTARSRLYGPVLSVEGNHGEATVSQFFVPYKQKTDQSAATLNWNLLNGGADKAEYDASERELAAAREDLRRAREEGAERIAQTYIEALRYQELSRFSDMRIRALQELVDKARLQHESGKLSEADFVEISANMADAEIDQDQLRVAGTSAMSRLRALVGGELRPLVEVADEALTVLLPAPLAPGAVAQLDGASDGPGIVAAARRRAEAAKARVPGAWSSWAPKIDFQYQHQLYDQSRPQTTQQQKSGWQVTARWDLPLGGEISSRRQEAISRAQAALDEVDRIQLTVDAERVSLPERVQLSDRALSQLRLQQARYDTLVQTSTLQYDAGRRTLLQLAQIVGTRFIVHQRTAEQLMQKRSAQTRMLALQGELLPRLGLSN